MNHYGRLAQNHWSRWAPTQYAQVENKEEFFTQLGEEIAQRVGVISQDLESRLPASMPYLEKVGQMGAIRSQAEEVALDELVYWVETKPGSLLEELEDILGELPGRLTIPLILGEIYTRYLFEEGPQNDQDPDGVPLTPQDRETVTWLRELEPLVEVDPESLTEAEISELLPKVKRMLRDRPGN